MKGEIVIVRTFGGVPRLKRVWKANGNVVYACSNDRFSELIKGEDNNPLVGFPRKDVYVYNDSLEIGDLITDPAKWNTLLPWKERDAKNA